MQRIVNVFAALSLLALVVAGATLVAALRNGVSARDDPTAAEALLARRLRAFAIPTGARRLANPIASSDEVLREARHHFADHCAVCHGADGKGETAINEGLYPEAPDMTADATQALSDGELFWIIRNGVRFTGMPGWGGGDPAEDRESWGLVHLIRRLPALGEDELREIEAAMPSSRHALEEEARIEEFLRGEREHRH